MAEVKLGSVSHHYCRSFKGCRFRSWWLSSWCSCNFFSSTWCLLVHWNLFSLQSLSTVCRLPSYLVLPSPWLASFTHLLLLSFMNFWQFQRFFTWLALAVFPFGSASSSTSLFSLPLSISSPHCPIYSQILWLLLASYFLAGSSRIISWVFSLFTSFGSTLILLSLKTPFKSLQFIGFFASYVPEFR